MEWADRFLRLIIWLANGCELSGRGPFGRILFQEYEFAWPLAQVVESPSPQSLALPRTHIATALAFGAASPVRSSKLLGKSLLTGTPCRMYGPHHWLLPTARAQHMDGLDKRCITIQKDPLIAAASSWAIRPNLPEHKTLGSRNSSTDLAVQWMHALSPPQNMSLLKAVPPIRR